MIGLGVVVIILLLVLVLLIGIIIWKMFLSSDSSTQIVTQTKYICPDGTDVTDTRYCPKTTTKKATTTQSKVTTVHTAIPTTTETHVTTVKPTLTTTLISGVVSNSFPIKDFCTFTSYTGSGIQNVGKTDLQKEDLFDTKYKNEYVQWSGTVASVSEGWLGGYTLQVKHCPQTFTSDIVISLKDDQKQNALKIMQGGRVTYRAKLTRWGSILGFSADEGVIIS